MKTIDVRRLLVQLTILVSITTNISAQVRADFSAPVTSGCPPLVVNFKDSSKGNPVSWKWDLGNGTISYLQNPSVAYFTPGTYNVKLVVKGVEGADSVVKRNFIVVNALPVPAFSVSDSLGCYPLKVRFGDGSVAGSGTIEKWQWDFGDGTLSNERNPVHTYTTAGSFTVILNVTNSAGCSKVVTKPAKIRVRDRITASFSYTSRDGCHSPTPVSFTNETVSTGLTTYQWHFGNGVISEEKNPVYNYKDEGVYSVKLVASNNIGCTDTLIKSDAINIGFVKADFSKPDVVCTGARTQFRNISSPSSFVKAQWFFGDDSVSSLVSPTHIFVKPGVYYTKLIIDFGSCKDSIVKAITVQETPIVNFTSTNNIGCKAPLTVNFTNTSGSAVAYQWNFGDGTRSSLPNPSHTYSKADEYRVALSIRNAAGCSSTVTREKFVKIIPPRILSIKNLLVTGCIPTTVSPIAVITDSLAPTVYLWDFGDGTTSADARPSHVYTTPGNFNVKLLISRGSGCTDSFTVINAVKAGEKPVAAFSADPLEVCAFAPVIFTDLSTGAPAQEWFWTYGEGGTSIAQNPSHVYIDTGYFNVSLIVSNFGCSDTLKKEKYIHVRPPIAKFDTAFFCSQRLKREFINTSVGATAWEWSFGDGSTSIEKEPFHTYSGSGVYEVILKVTNGLCEHTQKKNVVVVKESPVFEVSALETCANTSLVFNVSNTNAANIVSYNWYINGFGAPGSTTTNNTLNASYNTPGSRSAAVIITDLQYCIDTLYTSSPINIYGIKAGFGSAVTGTCFGNTIHFSDSTITDGIHPVASWVWDFGEGGAKEYTSSTAFVHDYSSVGFYDVKLVVADTYGCKDSITKPAYISISKPVAAFTASDTMLCPSTAVTFTNRSTALDGKVFWTFGDGTTSEEYAPTHQFLRSGSFAVKLLIVDLNGCRDSTSVIINVFTATADFLLSDSFSTCPPLIVNITNKSTNYAEHFWDFGDGGNSALRNPSHIYSSPGIYTVTLLVKNNGGCTDTLVKSVEILGPKGLFTYTPTEVCKPAKINYELKSDNTVKYVWDFNDGTTVSNRSTTISHIYTTAGRFVPKVILEDTSGCKVALTGTDTVKVNEIETHILSDASLLCDSGYITFRDSTSTNDVLSSLLWNFGDGVKSDLAAPTHKFADTGNYTITLTATSKLGCTSTKEISSYIKVVNSPDVEIMGDTSVCQSGFLELSAASLRVDTSGIAWAWDFGNGQTSTLQYPESQRYSRAGSYLVTVKGTNSDGCTTIARKAAIIHPLPVVDAGEDTTICRLDSLLLQATGAAVYTWKSDPSLTCTNCQSPVARPDTEVTYRVTGKTVFGCTDDDSITVVVKQPFNMIVANTDTVCAGESIVLNVTGADFYTWTPSLFLNNPNISAPTSTPATSITYQVTGKDSVGCFSETASITLKVVAKPTIEITNGENITIQIGSDVKIGTQSSSDVTSWSWYPPQWLNCGTCPEPTTSAKDNITYNVTAKNEGNCEAQDKVTVNVICNNSNVFLPNTFSPNADGMNDQFYPRGVGLYNIKSFKIFDRWGQLVFTRNGISANNAADGWDGTRNGVKLPIDVYVYILEVLCLNNIVLPFKGNVSLIR